MASTTDLKSPEGVPTTGAETSGTVARGPNQATLRRGALVDRYTILDPLGSGGFATVYAAYDAQLERIVALKVLQTDVDLPDARRRLFREAQAMARLKHPNVVTVYDVGRFDRKIYIAMECIEGTTLREWAKTPRSWREAMAVLKSAGRGLAAAHEAGLVHRDFKPENVLVGNDGRVLVSDFGIARPTDELENAGAAPVPVEPESPAHGARADFAEYRSNRTEDPLTETGRVMGTHGYLAPERLVSAADDVRSDQFSFCVAMYVTLYGRHPFVFTNIASYSAAVQKPPQPPPSSTKVPSWVHAVIERGLRTDPEKRFLSMSELLDALDRDPSRRRRMWALGSCMAAACAVAAVAYARHRVELHARASEGQSLMAATWNPAVEETIRSALAQADSKHGAEIAEQAIRKIGEYAVTWSEAHREVSEATLLRGEQDAVTMARRLRCLERGREQLSALAEVLARADAAVAQRAIDAAFALPAAAKCASSEVAEIPAMPSAPDVRARVLKAERESAQVQAYIELGQDRQAQEIIARVLSEARAIPYPRAEAQLLILDGDSKLQLSDKSGALESVQGAFRAALRAGDDALAVRAATSVVYLLSTWFHKPQEAEQWLELANAIGDRAGLNDVMGAEILLARAAINATSGHPERNPEIHEKHIATLKRLYGGRDPRVARATMDLGVTLALIGQYESAARSIQEGVDLMAAVGGAHNPRLALYYLNLASAFEALGRFEDAKAAHEHGLALLADRPPGPMNVIMLAQLALLENELGRPEAAFAAAEKGVEVATAIGEKGKFEWLARYAHAQARGKRADWHGQAEECTEIVALQRAAGQVASNVPYFPDALACVAEAELELNEIDAAISHLRESVRLESRGDAEALPKAQFALAKALRRAEREPARARQLAEGARDDLGKLASKQREIEQIERWLAEEPPLAATR